MTRISQREIDGIRRQHGVFLSNASCKAIKYARIRVKLKKLLRKSGIPIPSKISGNLPALRKLAARKL